MKKYANKSEFGSIMIEALAMLALIALVTPVLYKKSAERTTELQDINAASELRAIIKAVDDYVSANYDAITNGEKVTNSCAENEINYNSFKNAEDANLTVPIAHFCEFLPYGILDSDGNAQSSRLFSPDYQIVLKLKGSSEEHGDKVVTAFVVTDPQQEDGLPMIRASNIASMIGGNGGYVSEVSGSGEEGTGKVSGNLGIWGIDNTRTELGISVKKGAIVAASIQGISSQNAKLDLTGVLYREEKEDPNLNTMSTTLYMGSKGEDSYGQDMVNIGHLIVGAQTADSDDRLYIKSGNITIGDGEGDTGSIRLNGEGDITLANGGIDVTGGNIMVHGKAGEIPEGATEAPINGGNLYVDGEMTAANSLFHVSVDGVVTALSYLAGDEGVDDYAVQIHVQDGDNYKTTVKEPLEVEADGDCTYTTAAEGGEITLTTPCALYVKGNALIGGNLTVTETFSAKNLHAQEKLTVGGTGADESKALSVVYNAAVPGTEGSVDKASLNFGSGLLNVNQTDSNKGDFNFANLVKIDTDAKDGEDSIGKQFLVDMANNIRMTTSTGELAINDEYMFLDSSSSGESSSYATMQLQGKDSSGTNLDGTIRMEVSRYLSMNENAFVLETADSNKNKITSQVESFKIKPTDIDDGTDNYFQVSENTEGGASDKGQVLMKGINTYMLDTNQYLRGSVFHVQKTTPGNEETGTPATHSDIIRIAENSDSDNSQIDISGEQITAHEKGGTTQKVLKIDLSPTIPEEGGDPSYEGQQNGYPVYIRRGAIELREVEAGKSGLSNNTYHNYVQADRFVANHKLEDNALIDHGGTNAVSNMNYEVNPAYTSVMHDIKLTTRGGARLSDILPDFINKGIYVVDNTYPSSNETCSSAGKTLTAYKGLSRENKQGVSACTSITQEVSPWAGFVPTPTCPPGYSKVITLTPASFAMAQAGIPYPKSSWDNAHKPVDLAVPYVVKSPYDYLDESAIVDTPPTPLYYQKNTWLKSFVDKYENSSGVFEGWDVGMGFIYPYNMYSDYITKLGGKNYFDRGGCDEGTDSCVIWNLFPVYAGTLEGYATVYCYFNRSHLGFQASLVDKEYDQIENFRDYWVKDNSNYTGRLNDDRSSSGASEW